MRTQWAPASIAFSASVWLKWMSAITGNRRLAHDPLERPARPRRAARRTGPGPPPASAIARICRMVASTSAVSVFVIDCTATGAPPPIFTPPTSIWRVEAKSRILRLATTRPYRCLDTPQRLGAANAVDVGAGRRRRRGLEATATHDVMCEPCSRHVYPRPTRPERGPPRRDQRRRTECQPELTDPRVVLLPEPVEVVRQTPVHLFLPPFQAVELLIHRRAHQPEYQPIARQQHEDRGAHRDEESSDCHNAEGPSQLPRMPRCRGRKRRATTRKEDARAGSQLIQDPFLLVESLS